MNENLPLQRQADHGTCRGSGNQKVARRETSGEAKLFEPRVEDAQRKDSGAPSVRRYLMLDPDVSRLATFLPPLCGGLGGQR